MEGGTEELEMTACFGHCCRKDSKTSIGTDWFPDSCVCWSAAAAADSSWFFPLFRRKTPANAKKMETMRHLLLAALVLWFSPVCQGRSPWQHRTPRQIFFEEEPHACPPQDGLPVKCTFLPNCPTLFHLLEWKPREVEIFLRQSACGFVGFEPKICCPRPFGPAGYLPSTPTLPRPPPSVNVPAIPPGQVNPPIGQVIPPTGQVIPPTGQVIPPTGQVNRPQVPVPPGGSKPQFPPSGTQNLPTPPVPAVPQPPSAPISNSLLPAKCGNVYITRTRIVGGTDAPRGAWPWMAHLRFENRSNGQVYRVCGGALITDQHVLTAAHCIRESDPIIQVRLGEHESGTEEDKLTSQNALAVQITPHEQFNRMSFQNDIAILKLDKKIRFNNNVEPICLPDASFMARNFVGAQPWIAGWGATRQDGVGSRILKEVQVPVITNDACKQFYQGTPASIDDKTICAGFKEGGKDSCQGDSGGPLMVPHGKDERFYLLGIVSFGIGCAQAQFPGVYTRVSAQMNWINSKLR